MGFKILHSFNDFHFQWIHVIHSLLEYRYRHTCGFILCYLEFKNAYSALKIFEIYGVLD